MQSALSDLPELNLDFCWESTRQRLVTAETDKRPSAGIKVVDRRQLMIVFLAFNWDKMA